MPTPLAARTGRALRGAARPIVLAPCLVPWLGVAIAVADTQPPAAPAAAPAVDSTGSLEAHRVTSALRIDGRLDEDAWRDAAPTGHFTQDSPHHGQDATSPTEVRVLYDDQYLYVGARMRHAAGAGQIGRAHV